MNPKHDGRIDDLTAKLKRLKKNSTDERVLMVAGATLSTVGSLRDVADQLPEDEVEDMLNSLEETVDELMEVENER